MNKTEVIEKFRKRKDIHQVYESLTPVDKSSSYCVDHPSSVGSNGGRVVWRLTMRLNWRRVAGRLYLLWPQRSGGECAMQTEPRNTQCFSRPFVQRRRLRIFRKLLYSYLGSIWYTQFHQEQRLQDVKAFLEFPIQYFVYFCSGCYFAPRRSTLLKNCFKSL